MFGYREVEGIKRVVLTSSVVAVAGSIGADDGSRLFTERDWPESPDSLGGYAKSKMLAEREAWSFVKALPAEKRFELTVINPSYVMGPVLSGEVGAYKCFTRYLARWSSSCSDGISSLGRRCPNVSAKSMPVPRHSDCCCHRTERICDEFLQSL